LRDVSDDENPIIVKKTALAILFSVMLFSCSKNEDDNPVTPVWLTYKIAQMESDDFYYGAKVYLYEWNNASYYWIFVPLSSCMMCEFYDYNGDKLAWTQTLVDDFQKNARQVRIIWERDHS